MTHRHKYSKEQIEFINKNVKGRAISELTEMFNKEFNLNLTVDQIRGFMKRHKLRNGIDSKFQKGRIKPNKTSFKKGHKPSNIKAIGYERVCKDGYVRVKVAEPSKWELKQRIIWEENFGEIPKGFLILFADSNKQNFKLDNLILVSKKQMQMINLKNLIKDDAELTKTGVQIASLLIKIKERNS